MDVAHSNNTDDATILLVEDDSTLRSTLAFNLRREGYRVLSADTGPAALDVVTRHGAALNLIILDVMLPGMNGLQVLRKVRTHHDVAVLLLSAKGEEHDKVDGLELGANDYVVKPFALRELLARVRAAVRRHAAPSARPPGTLYRGELRVELDRRRATVHGVELRLRPKEFGLLATLAMEPGRIFSRQELLDLVWGNEVIVEERSVDVHISWLRSKLEAAGLDGACIGTVYGAGYRFAQVKDFASEDGVANRLG